jgi:hypothetical protein
MPDLQEVTLSLAYASFAVLNGCLLLLAVGRKKRPVPMLYKILVTSSPSLF